MDLLFAMDPSKEKKSIASSRKKPLVIKNKKSTDKNDKIPKLSKHRLPSSNSNMKSRKSRTNSNN